MPVTNFKISMNEYMRLVAEDAKKAEGSPIYSKLLKDLSELAAMMQGYFKTNAEGKAPILSPDDYKKLIRGYSAVAEDCNKFLADDHDKNRLETQRINVITRLSSYVGKDLRGLLKADQTKEATLSDVVEAARTKTVDLTGKDLGFVGGAQNSRIPLKSTYGAEGFFTKKNMLNYQSAIDRVKGRFREILPSEFTMGLQDESSAREFFDSLETIPAMNNDSPVAELKENEYLNFARVLQTLNNELSMREIIDIMKENQQFTKDILMAHKEYFRALSQKATAEIVGMSDGSRLDQRNAAMSDVAALLGMSGIIARSIPMKIVQDGQVTEGTFMEKAEGEDIQRPSQDSLMFQTDQDTFNHPEGLKQLTDLQILDYICRNTDRHCGNIMYKFEKKEGKVVLAGITGIDNDTSFGTRTFETQGSTAYITPLSNIINITMSCHEALQNLSADALRVALADKLKTEEIEAACQRLNLLKTKINNKEINPVPDQLWGKDGFTYDKLTKATKKYQVGIGSVLYSAIKTINSHKEKMQDLPEKASELTFAAGKDVTDQAEARFQEIYSKLEGFVTRAGNLKRKLHVNSEEYSNMLRSLKTAIDDGKEIKEALQRQEDVKLDRFKKFAKTVVELGISSQEYMSAKNLSQFTELGKDRIVLAADMRDLAQENFAIKEAAPEVKKPEAVKEPEPKMIF